MSAFKKEWTAEEIRKLGQDLNTAKIKVLSEHGFTVEEIVKLMDIPSSAVLTILGK